MKLGKQKKKGVKLHDFSVRAGDGIMFWLAGCCAGLSPSSHDTNAFFSALSCAQVQMAVLFFCCCCCFCQLLEHNRVILLSLQFSASC